MTDSRENPVDRARRLISSPPDVSRPSRYPRAAKLARRTVNRGLSDYANEMRLRLDAVLDALEEDDRLLRSGMDQKELWDRFQALGNHIERLFEVVTQHERQIAGLDLTVVPDLFAESRAKIASMHSDLAAHRQSTEAALSEVRRLLTDAMESASLNGLQESLSQLSTDVGRHLSGVDHQINRLTAEAVARPYMSDEAALRTTDSDGHRTLGFESGRLTHYADFEDLFRGSPALIAERLEPYLPILSDHTPVMDVGCGRGELLELLRGHAIPASGVDPDQSMVERCRDRQLDVVHTDGISALNAVSAGSLGAVISVQVVEHIAVEEMRSMFAAGWRALRPGGVFIAETVNPHSPMALKAFWLDLTHVRPLYPESLLMLAQETGFDSGYVLFPAGSGDLDEDLRNCGEYAVVARKG